MRANLYKTATYGVVVEASLMKEGGTNMKTRFPNNVGILAVDLAKRNFQVCAAASNGEVLHERKFSRPKLEQRFLGDRSASLVAMEACSTAHHWGRFALAAGHDVRTIAPTCASRSRAHENAGIDAAAVRQPCMRFVEPKSQDRQARGDPFET